MMTQIYGTWVYGASLGLGKLPPWCLAYSTSTMLYSIIMYLVMCVLVQSTVWRGFTGARWCVRWFIQWCDAVYWCGPTSNNTAQIGVIRADYYGLGRAGY
jgi:hypothetical protein